MNPALMRYLVWPLVKFLVAFIIVQVIVAAMNWVELRESAGVAGDGQGAPRFGFGGVDRDD